ncbi:P-loop containing nucleoside triphosphate hydrolase protein [Xylariaceae sp. FL0804]|nr:P-loop containing nucleoside triphosphate hydrolase protein [Xylariaceae sp. FL0804]
MSDYDSGDDLLGDVDIDNLVAGSKRPQPPDDSQTTAKRPRLADDAQYDEIATSLLGEKFGFSNFRHEQAAAIRALLRGDNALVVFPTGAGKSLCYQIPGIAFERLDASGLRGGRAGVAGSGITIVVSPLIALMKDQVDALVRRGIAAACLDSTKTWEEVRETTAAMREGRLRLLYCAPERLNNEGFVQTMKHVPGGVRLLAVDEAHCISEWGHSFRPDYLKVARFAHEIGAERVICLTATATPRVADDVCRAFGIDQPANVFRTSPYRPNLRLEAEVVETQRDKLPRLVRFLREHAGPSLVYITTQRSAEELATALRREGMDAAAFHAGLKTEDKTRIQDDFMAGRTRIVVATIAFGMGIDKADIRNIVHHDFSGTVEEYSQQIGRAGRDGRPSHCLVYLCNEDWWKRENFARGDLPSRPSLRALLEEIFCHQELFPLPEGGESIKLSLYRLGQDHDIRASPLSILLATLELRFGLLRAITPEYSSYQFEAGPGYPASVEGDGSRESRAIVRHATAAKKWHSVDLSGAADAEGLLRPDLVRRLNELHDRGALKLKVGGVVNRYKVLKSPLPSSPGELDALAFQLHAEMRAREDDAMRRAEQVVGLLTADKCFARSLAEHFGMGLPSDPDPDPDLGRDGKRDRDRCGHCTHCLTGGKRVVLPPRPARRADEAGIRAVLDACDVRDDPRFLARVAFGIVSPRVTRLKLARSPVFGSLQDHDFESLMAAFTKACEEAGLDDKA